MSSEARATDGLRRQVVRGGLLLTSQRVLSTVIAGLGGIVLARLLIPELFGIYGIISFVVGVGVVIGDLGIGAAFLQRRDLDINRSLSTAFTAQLLLALLLGSVIAISAPFWVHWLGLEPSTIAPLQCLSILMPLAALRIPGAVLLERDLRYGPVTLAETLDTLVFHAVAILAALSGGGVWSFVLSAIVARVSSIAVVWHAARWWPAFQWSWPDLKSVLRFGIPFQGTAILTMLRDAVMPIIVALWSGVVAVGFLSLATSIAFLPLSFVRIVGRVLFPALSRLQDDPQRFAGALDRGLNRIALILVPCALLVLVGADPIVRLVYGELWVPAIPAVRLLCIAAMLGGPSNIMVYALFALGRAKLVWNLNVFWTLLLWILSLTFVPSMGFVGYAVASAVVSATVVVPAVLLRRLVPIHFMAQVRVPLAAGLMSALAFGVFVHLWVQDISTLILGGSVAATVYVCLVYAMSHALWRSDVGEDWQRVFDAHP